MKPSNDEQGAQLHLLAISGSCRKVSTNTALLRAAQDLAPRDLKISIYEGIDRLPVFSPDLEIVPLPDPVNSFHHAVEQCDGLIISSPEYVRSIPGGLKNAIDWLVSGESIVKKPVALLHASHRGEDMLAALRLVLSTVTDAFTPHIFEQFHLMGVTPTDIDRIMHQPENSKRVTHYLTQFSQFCRSQRKADFD